MKTTWKQITDNLKESLDPGIYKVWIQPVEAELTENSMVLKAPNTFMAEWIKRNLKSIIHTTAARLYQLPLDSLFIEIKAKEAPPIKQPESVKDIIKNVLPKTQASEQMLLPLGKQTPTALTWRYKFEDFVIGNSNSFAVAAAKDLCQKGQVRSLFVTSASGLGKTHLAQAAGRLISENGQSFKIAYLTAENFASRYVQAMRSKDLEGFKQYLCNLDALIFEDVHFLQKKKAMQELALYVIKNLDAKGARIIFTSSFTPHQLRDMDEQLASYLSSGIMANMDKPDYEMRKEILERKAKFYQVNLPDEISDMLSQRLSSDIRQLEACLQNMIFKAKLLNAGLTLDIAMETISQYGTTQPTIDINGILKLVCESYGISETQLKSRSRKHDYVQGRNMVFFLARKHTELSLETIGNSLNRRHSTVLRSITQVEKELACKSREGRQLAKAMELIEKRCGLN